MVPAGKRKKRRGRTVDGDVVHRINVDLGREVHADAEEVRVGLRPE